jgi:hypothetical protein
MCVDRAGLRTADHCADARGVGGQVHRGCDRDELLVLLRIPLVISDHLRQTRIGGTVMTAPPLFTLASRPDSPLPGQGVQPGVSLPRLYPSSVVASASKALPRVDFVLMLQGKAALPSKLFA